MFPEFELQTVRISNRVSVRQQPFEPISDHQKLFTEFSTQIERKSTGITIRQREPLRLMHGIRTHYRVPGVHEDVFSTVSYRNLGKAWKRPNFCHKRSVADRVIHGELHNVHKGNRCLMILYTPDFEFNYFLLF